MKIHPGLINLHPTHPNLRGGFERPGSAAKSRAQTEHIIRKTVGYILEPGIVGSCKDNQHETQPLVKTPSAVHILADI